MEIENVVASDKMFGLRRHGDLVLTNKRIVWEGKFFGQSKKSIELKLKDIVKVDKVVPCIKAVGITLHTKDSKYYFVKAGVEDHILTRTLKKHYTGKEPGLIELGERVKELI